MSSKNKNNVLFNLCLAVLLPYPGKTVKPQEIVPCKGHLWACKLGTEQVGINRNTPVKKTYWAFGRRKILKRMLRTQAITMFKPETPGFDDVIRNIRDWEAEKTVYPKKGAPKTYPIHSLLDHV